MKTWKHYTFGKDWFYDLFVAFGDLEVEMLEALNESCEHRANTSTAPEFCPHGDRIDPATTRTTTELQRLSRRGAAAAMSFSLPPVRGLQKTQPRASDARGDAKEMEEELDALEVRWEQDDVRMLAERRGVVARAWEKARQLSVDAGHDFTGRNGVVERIREESSVARAVRKYLADNPWPTVARYIRYYDGRPKKGRGRAATQGAPQPKRARR